MVVVCAECSESDQTFTSVENLQIHITVDHVGWIPYQCFFCEHEFMPTETVLRNHYRQYHRGKNVKVLFNTNKKREAELATIMRRSTEASTHDTHSSEVSIREATPLFDDLQTARNFSSTPKNTDSHKQLVGLKRDLTQTPICGDTGETMISDSLDKTAAKKKRLGKATNSWRPLAYCNLCERQLPTTDGSFHVWEHHFKKPVMECRLCGFSVSNPGKIKTLKKHIMMEHQINVDEDKSADALVDNRPTLFAEFDELRRRCFDSSRSGERRGTISLEQQLAVENANDCSKCGLQNVNKGSRYDHVYWHLKEDYAMPRVKCSVGDCQFTSHTVVAMQIHLRHFHRVSEAKFVDLTDEKLTEKYLECIQICFPIGDTIQPTTLHSAATETTLDFLAQQTPIKMTVQASQSSAAAAPAKNESRLLAGLFKDRLAYCDLCERQLGVSPSNNGLGLHVWRYHVNKPIYQCNQCDYHVRVPAPKYIRNHISGMHPDKNPDMDFTDMRSGLMAEYDAQKSRCFASDRNGEVRGYPLQVQSSIQRATHCSKCGQAMGKNSKFDHMYLHLKDDKMKPRFVCSVGDCQCTSSTLSSIDSHLRSFHKVPTIPGNYDDRTKAIDGDLAAMREECFPIMLSA